MSLCKVTFLEEKKRPTSQTFPFDIIRAMYSRRATVSPNSIRVCPRRNALSESDNSVPVNVGITFDPAFSGWWRYKRASCICRWENALHGRWDMSRRKPIREFPTAAWKTTFAPSELRYTSQRTSESAPASRNQCIRTQGFIIIYRGEPFVVLFRYTRCIGYSPSHKFYNKFQCDFSQNRIYVSDFHYRVLQSIKF